MYIDKITVQNFRNFRKSEIHLTHRDLDESRVDFPKPKLPNINLLLGDNGLGKTSMLKAIALAALGPAVGDSGIYPYRLIRRGPKGEPNGNEHADSATIHAEFTPHAQDAVPGGRTYNHISKSLGKATWSHCVGRKKMTNTGSESSAPARAHFSLSVMAPLDVSKNKRTSTWEAGVLPALSGPRG